MNDEMNSDNYKKLAQFCVLTEEYLDRRYAEKILEQGYDLNYQAPADAFFALRKPDLIGSTALHVAMGNKDIFTYLLDSGADVTVKNAKGMTVLHQAVWRIYDDYAEANWLRGRFESKLVNDYATLVLDAHVKSNSRANPRDANGISHMHVACMTNDARAIEFFLRDGGGGPSTIDQTVNQDSPIFPGYAPLHIALKCNCLDVVDVLLQRGAHADTKDAKGRCALQVALERNMEIVDWMHVCEDSTAHYYHLSLHSDIRTRENSVIKLMMHAKARGYNGGLSRLHVACALGDASLAEHSLRRGCDIDESVRAKYPLWRGYTPLHFAAHSFNVDALKLLLRNGANVEAKDAHGATPLDVCEGRLRVKDVLFVVASHPSWRSVVLSDGRTKLTDLLEAMRQPDGFAVFLDESKLNVNSSVPFDSPIWSGYTILHLAVTFTETLAITSEHVSCGVKRRRRRRHRESSTYLDRLEVCLKRGADVTAQDAKARTPLIRAFRSGRLDAVKLLLQCHWSTSNPIDTDDLSHLYVACHAEDDRVVGRLLSNGADANATINRSFQWHENEHSFVRRYRSRNRRVVEGSTPLHAAVARGSIGIASMLLRRGADVNARDRDGWTPIHETLCASHNADRIFDLLVSSRDVRPCDLHCGLNYLHVAVYFDDVECVRRLIDMGVEVNARIECLDQSSELPSFAIQYSGCTPLHVNLRKSKSRDDISELLIRRGADIFIGNSAGINSLRESLTIGCNDDFVASVVEGDSYLQKLMLEDSGMTMLHIACWKLDVALARDRLNRGDDVNARVHRRSAIWPGWTPLHVLMTRSAVATDDRVLVILRLMMESGADVSLTNDDELATPLHVIEDDGNSTYANSSFASLLLRRTCCNRMDVDGISHFHVACIRSDLEVMDNFLQGGVNVDEHVNFFSAKYPGYAPLHFAVTAELSVAAVELLLRYRANVHARDTCGNTPLHVMVRCGHLREALLKILIRAGADINATNIFGETPLEVLLKSNNATSADIRLFLEYDCHLNSFNPMNNEGYMSHILTREYSHRTSASTNLLLENVMSSCDIFDIDAEGRTVIHNIVATKKTWIDDYSDILRKLLTRGCDVDQQDMFGRTALHVAVQFNNNEAVLGLLEAGADINILDVNGKTPLVTCLELIDECNEYTNRFRRQLLVKILVFHVYKLQITGLQVNKRNTEVAINLMTKIFMDKNTMLLLRSEIEMTKCVMIGSSVTLYNFLSDTGAVAAYPIMTYAERISVDDFFRHDKSNLIFNELNSLLNLQYRKALKRTFLNRVGTSALNAIANFQFPELCSRAILRCLTNDQLENLNRASFSDYYTNSFENR